MKMKRKTKDQEMQAFMRHYRHETGIKEIDMHAVAEKAISMGWKLPKQPTPAELLAKEFSRSAREETRTDKVTGRLYRVNHAFTIESPNDDQPQQTRWVDIDEAPRNRMLKSAVNRREQMVGDAYQLTLDLDHWNSVNPNENPIKLPMDFTDDVEERKLGQAAA